MENKKCSKANREGIWRMAKRKPIINRDRDFIWNARTIREARMIKGKTQGQMAKELGVPQQRISEHELGVHTPGQMMQAFYDMYFKKKK